MTDKVRWGILSTANIGRKRVTPAIIESSNGVVAAVCSRSLEAAQAYAGEFDIPYVYGAYQELLDPSVVDAIYNPLPNHLHAEWSIKAAQAGIPVLCEKPLALDADQAQQMVDAFKTRDVLFAEAFMYRFHPQTVRVKQMVEDGAIGDLQVMKAAFTFRLGPDRAGDVRLQKDMGGGSVMDVGCYCINVMRLMSGQEPDSVTAQAVFGLETDVDEWLVGTLHFPSGILGHFDSSLRSAFSHTCDLRGTAGRILVEEAFVPAADRRSSIRYWSADGYQVIEIPPANQYTIMVEDFADALLNSRPPRFDPQDAVHNMRVIDQVRAAARERS